MDDEKEKRQPILFGLLLSAAIAVVAIIVLVVNAIVGPWRYTEALKWVLLTVLCIGFLLSIVLGAVLLYRELMGNGEDGKAKKDEDKKANEAAQMTKSGVIRQPKTGGDQAKPYDPLSCKDESIRVFRTMTANVKAISDFYRISKNQASVAFILSVSFCAAGLVLLFLPLILGAMRLYSDSVAMVGIIGGAVSELFGGTVLLVQKGSSTQFKQFYEALHDNEMLLAAITLAEKLPEKQRESAFEKIIESSLKCMTDNSKASSPGDTGEPAAKPAAGETGAKPAAAKPTGQAGQAGGQKPGAPSGAGKANGG